MKKRQRGIAVITVLLVVAIATVAAAAIVAASAEAIIRTTNEAELERAWWFAESGEAAGLSLLQADGEEGEVDHLNELWSTGTLAAPMEGDAGGTIQGRLIDLQGRFNLNNLGVFDPDEPEVNQRYVDQFERLLECIAAETEGMEAFGFEELALAVRDWVDLDPDIDGVGDTDYQILEPAYRAANRALESPSELLAVRGMTPKLWLVLSQHVTALPEQQSPINVNTATPAVLCSLSDDPDDQQKLADFADTRMDEPLEDRSQLTEDFSGVEVPVDVRSRYFLGWIEGRVGRARVSLVTLFGRPLDGAPVVLGHSTERACQLPGPDCDVVLGAPGTPKQMQ